MNTDKTIAENIFAACRETASKPSATRGRSYAGGYMEAGKYAEELYSKLAKSHGFDVTDVRDDPDYQEKGIDFLLIKESTQYSVDVKSDRHLDISDNFLFELMRVNHTADPVHRFKLGWSAQSKAGSVAFYAPSSKYFHTVLLREYRDAANEAFFKLRNDIGIIIVPTDAIKSTINALIPMQFLVEQPSYKKIYAGEIT